MIAWAVRLVNVAIVVVICVVLLGAWTRINNAGLSCPDWPGCYGQLIVTNEMARLSEVQEVFPNVPIEINKVWLEMGHRYLAGSLGVLILGLAIIAYRVRSVPDYPLFLSFCALVLVVVQAVFGMWTVTLKLLPQIVTLHLLGGVLTLTTLVLLRLRLKRVLNKVASTNASISKWLLGAVLIVLLQIVLGGWTSANYAGYGCSEWLVCSQSSELEPNYKEGFNLAIRVGPNYEGGILPLEARAAIQIIHRLGAVIVFVYCIILAMALWRVYRLRRALLSVIGILICQLTLGSLIAVLSVPATLAMLHHLFAILLLLSLLGLYSKVRVEFRGTDYE